MGNETSKRTGNNGHHPKKKNKLRTLSVNNSPRKLSVSNRSFGSYRDDCSVFSDSTTSSDSIPTSRHRKTSRSAGNKGQESASWTGFVNYDSISNDARKSVDDTVVESILDLDLDDNPESWLSSTRFHVSGTGLCASNISSQDHHPPFPQGDTSDLVACSDISEQILNTNLLPDGGNENSDSTPCPIEERSAIKLAQNCSATYRRKTKSRRSIYVPQDWNSIIIFLKGYDLHRISKTCKVDIRLSTISVECTPREKGILRADSKRAVHICGSQEKDVEKAIVSLGRLVPILTTKPDKTETSFIRKKSNLKDASESDSSGTVTTVCTLKSENNDKAVDPSPGTLGAAKIVKRMQLNSSMEDLMTTTNCANPQQFDARVINRRQLKEVFTPILEIEVENKHQTLFPFFRRSSDRRGIVVAARSGCSVEVTDKIKRKNNGEERRVLCIKGPSMSALEKCVRLLDMHFDGMAARTQFQDFKDSWDKKKATQLQFS